jgi:hypothetical protein
VRAVIVKIDADQITDWDSFHAVFKRDLGFPNFYGQNMNAWIDCMISLDDADSGMTGIVLKDDELAILEIKGVKSFRERCGEILDALIECASFVNYSRREAGERPVLSLMLIE